MTLREIKKSITALRPRQLVSLHAWLHELINAAEAKELDRTATGRRVLKEHKTINKTYRSEMVRCGKKGCKCARGELHGPYWYAYWTEGGKTKSEYVGKELPKTRERALPRRVR